MEVIKTYFSYAILFSALVVASSASDPDSNSSSCDTLKLLAKELYNTKRNVLNMTKIFFPPLQDAAKFLQVRYSFEDENGDVDNCNISYIWAEGGFLLIQPPWIFQFTSLFFNHIANNNYDPHLELTLPKACRHLVHVHNNSLCSCKKDTRDGDRDLLDVLTHQV